MRARLASAALVALLLATPLAAADLRDVQVRLDVDVGPSDDAELAFTVYPVIVAGQGLYVRQTSSSTEVWQETNGITGLQVESKDGNPADTRRVKHP